MTVDSKQVRSIGRRYGRWLVSPLLAGGAVLLGLTVFVSLASLKEGPPLVPPAQRVFRVPVFLMERVDVRPLVLSFGTARAEQEVQVSAEVSGRVVAAERIDVGRAVRGPGTGEDNSEPGELLIQIDPETYRQRALQAEALLAQDAAEIEALDQEMRNKRQLWEQKQHSLASAKSQWELQRRLVTEGAGRQTEFQRAELELQQYEAAALQLQTDLNLEAARRKQIQARQKAHERDLEMAQLDVQRAAVRTPFSGVISQTLVETGQYVRPGDPLLKLSNVERVEIALPLPVSRSAAVSVLLQSGVQPRVQLADHEAAECRWVGRVTRIAPVANELTRTVDVYAEVENRPGRDVLRPGTFVQGRIESAELRGVLLLPRDALIEGSVFVVTNGGAAGRLTAERRPVEIAGYVESFAMVKSGLSPGDRVVLTSLDVLSNGTPLTVVNERTVRTELERESMPALELLEGTPLADRPQGERAE